MTKTDLTSPCENYLFENANDPKNLDIIENVIKGQSKNGWVVVVKYRGKNGYGGIVLQRTEFDVRYSVENKNYYVFKAYL